MIAELSMSLLVAGAGALPDAKPIHDPTNPSAMYQRWLPGPIRCAAGRAVPDDALIAPVGILGTPYRVPTDALEVDFTIDGEGRPLSIRYAEENLRLYSAEQDVLPALAASNFPATGEATACAVTYKHVVSEPDDTPLIEMARYNAFSRANRMPRSVWQRIGGGDCQEKGRLYPVTLSYPDFRDVEAIPGQAAFSYVRYDVSEEGVPRNVELVLSSGDEAIDRETFRAVSDSRFRAGERTGCVRAGGKSRAPLPAPNAPDHTPGDSADARCEAPGRWAKEPKLVYPSAYLKRGVEGWALIRYDVAPWGQTGAVEVIAAQPTSEFGTAAKALINSASYKAMESGLSGCVEKIVYRMRGKQAEPDDGEMNAGPETLALNERG